MLLGALEAGGTKMVCAIGNEEGTILDRVSFPTRTPKETIPGLVAYFKQWKVEALGIGAFGPIDLEETSTTYGYILDTPKTAWRNFDLLGSMRKELLIPIGLDTDVNSSCLGEMIYGCAKGLNSVLYLTIGTGIGAGIGIDGNLLHGMLHPEAGHALVTRHPKDTYEGGCPYHGTCLEGMASGPAIEKRWGKKAYELAEEEMVWEMEGYYIAQALTNYILTLSPRKIILGGGVMKQLQLLPIIRRKVGELLGGYLNTKELRDMDTYIVVSNLQDNQGILGCFHLAKLATE